MKKSLCTVVLFLAVAGLSGCGESPEPASPTEPDTAPPEVAETRARTTSEASDSTGSFLSLEVDGMAKSFTHFPADKNLTMSMTTMVLAKPSPQATEEFSMAVMGFDLSKAELPVSLKLGLREAMETDDPAQFASAPKPLISYISPEGIDYTSYATVVFDQYEDGIATGRVEDIELEPADGDAPPLMLSDIRFEVAL